MRRHRIHCPRRVNHRRAGIDRDRHAERFRDFLAGSAVLQRFSRVHGDTAVAAQTDRYRERDQFAPDSA